MQFVCLYFSYMTMHGSKNLRNASLEDQNLWVLLHLTVQISIQWNVILLYAGRVHIVKKILNNLDGLLYRLLLNLNVLSGTQQIVAALRQSDGRRLTQMSIQVL